MDKEPEPERVRFTFQAEGKGPSLIIRVRWLLKYAKRQLGLKCVDADKGKPQDDR